MRPGRLDRILYVGPPDLEGRKEILRIRTTKMSVEPSLDLEELARIVSGHTFSLYVFVVLMTVQTDGCSGAELTALCQEAALLTMKQDINAPQVSARTNTVFIVAESHNEILRFPIPLFTMPQRPSSDKSRSMSCEGTRLGEPPVA